MRLGWFLPCATLCFVLKESPEGMERLYINFVPIFDDDFVGLSRTGRDLTDLSVESHFGDSHILSVSNLITAKKHAAHSEEGSLQEVSPQKTMKKMKKFVPSPVDEMAERIGKSLGQISGQWPNNLITGGQSEREPAPDVLLGSEVQQTAEFVVRASQAVVSQGPREVATHHAVSHNGAAALQTDIIDVSTFPTPTMQSPIPYKELEQTTEASLKSEGETDFDIRGLNHTSKRPSVVLTHLVETGTGRVILPHYRTAYQNRRKPQKTVSQFRLADLPPSKIRHGLPAPPSSPQAPPSPQELAHHADLWLSKIARAGNKHRAKATPPAATLGSTTPSTIKSTIQTTTTANDLIPDLFETLPKPSHLRDHSDPREQLVTSETKKIAYVSSSPKVPFSADMNPTTDVAGNDLELDDTFRNSLANVRLEEKVEAEEDDSKIGIVDENNVRTTEVAGQSDQSNAQDIKDLRAEATETQRNSLTSPPSRTYFEDHSVFQDSTSDYRPLVETFRPGHVASPRPVRPLLVYGTPTRTNSEGVKTEKSKSIDDFVPSMPISNSVNPGDAIFYSNRPLSDSEYSKAVGAGSKFHAPYNLIPVDNPVDKQTLIKNKENVSSFRSPRRSDYNVNDKFITGDVEEKSIIFPEDEGEKNNFKPSTPIRKFENGILSSEDKFSPMDNDINTLLLSATARAEGIIRPSLKGSTTRANTIATITKTSSKQTGLEENPRWPKSKPRQQRKKKLSGNLVTTFKPSADYISSSRVASNIPKLAQTRLRHQMVGEEDTVSALNVIPPPPSKLLPPPKQSPIAQTAQKELFDGAGGGRLIDREGLLKALMKARDRDGFGTGAPSAAGESGPRLGVLTGAPSLQLPRFPTPLALLNNNPLASVSLMRYVDQGFKMVTKWLPGGLPFLGTARQYYAQ